MAVSVKDERGITCAVNPTPLCSKIVKEEDESVFADVRWFAIPKEYPLLPPGFKPLPPGWVGVAPNWRAVPGDWKAVSPTRGTRVCNDDVLVPTFDVPVPNVVDVPIIPAPRYPQPGLKIIPPGWQILPPGWSIVDRGWDVAPPTWHSFPRNWQLIPPHHQAP